MRMGAEVFSWLYAMATARAGAQIIIMNAQKQPDGTLQTQAVNVGRGVTRPM
jgi:heme oxygenase